MTTSKAVLDAVEGSARQLRLVDLLAHPGRSAEQRQLLALGLRHAQGDGHGLVFLGQRLSSLASVVRRSFRLFHGDMIAHYK